MNEELNKYTLELLEARRLEADACARRIEAEEKIAALIETGERQSKTVDVGNGFKVTVKRDLGYKADVSAIRALDLPQNLIPLKLMPSTYAFDDKMYEEVIQRDERARNLLAGCVEVKPRKTSVTVKAA